MPQKIFIGYRRQDTAANALGIGQYLEHEFGRKSVFIDVDMRAGTKFPAVLEQRLAECKVMLVLIGPEWLNSRDAKGRRRLDLPDDWVRLEIAHALSRNITVIPVRINDTPLPQSEDLPDDIRGLLDHQAVSITHETFRHEMSGLARDIRAIRTPGTRRRLVPIAAGLALLLIALALVPLSLFSNFLDRIRTIISPRTLETTTLTDIWPSKPGEWVLYAVDKQPIAYYFKPSSLQVVGDRVTFIARYPVKAPLANSPDHISFHAAYQDDTTILDCKRSVSLLAEKTVYDKIGEIISHYKRSDLASPDFWAAAQIAPGSILSMGAHVFCNPEFRTPLASELATTKLSFLAPTINDEAELFYGPPKMVSDPSFGVELLLTVRFYRDQVGFASLFPGQSVVGPAPTYRTVMQTMQMNCENRKMQSPKIEYYDKGNNLQYVVAPLAVPPLEYAEGSPLSMLLNVVCGAPILNITGHYEGMNYATYKVGGHQGEQRMSIEIEQTGSSVTASFRAPPAAEGKGTGTLSDNRVEAMTLQSTAPQCPGSFDASFQFANDSVTWTFKGQDCGGPMEGHGTAKRMHV